MLENKPTPPEPSMDEPESIQTSGAKSQTFILIYASFIAGLCSIIYELLISTASSYFLGDSIRQFSLTIGFYMAAMGIGSYLSKYINGNLFSRFVALEILLGFIGGISVPVLYMAFAFTDIYSRIMLLMICLVGILTGLEIPLLSRIMEEYYSLKVNLSLVLSFDYIGALAATLLFPFILLPMLGLYKSAVITGGFNMLIGFIVLMKFSPRFQHHRRVQYTLAALFITVLFAGLLSLANPFLNFWSDRLFRDPIVFVKQTPYQKLVMTRDRNDIRLFINGNLQFSSVDEFRYHESLVHVPFLLNRAITSVLILGGGDGLAVRELLKHSSVSTITLVDIDPEMTAISSRNPYLTQLNQDSLKNEKVSIHHQDALVHLKSSASTYDLIISDLPDPNNVSLARLYSKEFYQLVQKRLSKRGLFVTQSTSPFFARNAYWCINTTLKAAGFTTTYPYHALVPSFGDWGFVAATNMPKAALDPTQTDLSIPTRFLSNDLLPTLFTFSKDLSDPGVKPSTLDNPKILNYYLKGWQNYR